MSEDLLSPYRLVVSTLSPLHIGTGQKLGPLDFIRADGYMVVISETRLMKWVLSEKNNERLISDFVVWAERGRSIGDFLAACNRSYEDLVAYKVPVRTHQSLKDVQPFIKSANHQPYLPGSSIKGSLRSSLLRGVILENADLRQDFGVLVKNKAIGEKTESRKSASGEIQARVFSPNAPKESQRHNYDINRTLVLGDSNLKDAEKDLEVVEVKVLSTQIDQLKLKPMSLYLETLRSGVSLAFPARWQNHLLKAGGSASELKFSQIRRLMVYLPEFCRAASLQIMQQEIKFYKDFSHSLAGWYEAQRDDLQKRTDELFCLPMGWGSGYDAKAVTDLLGKAAFQAVCDNCRNTRGLGHPGNTPGTNWLGPELSPKSRKVVVGAKDDLKPLGWVYALFRPAQEDVTWYADLRQADAKTKPIILLSAKPAATVEVPKVTPGSQPVSAQSPKAAAPVQNNASLLPVPGRSPITRFSELPKSEDCFVGELYYEDDGALYVTIPGLDPESQAVAVILPKDRIPRLKVKEGNSIRCKVLTLKKDPARPKVWFVYCEQEGK